jgi:hypothetical protein
LEATASASLLPTTAAASTATCVGATATGIRWLGTTVGRACAVRHTSALQPRAEHLPLADPPPPPATPAPPRPGTAGSRAGWRSQPPRLSGRATTILTRSLSGTSVRSAQPQCPAACGGIVRGDAARGFTQHGAAPDHRTVLRRIRWLEPVSLLGDELRQMHALSAGLLSAVVDQCQRPQHARHPMPCLRPLARRRNPRPPRDGAGPVARLQPDQPAVCQADQRPRKAVRNRR